MVAVVSVDWLHEHLSEVTIVDCRFDLMQPDLGRQQYALGHLPGAYYLDLNRDLSSPVGKHGGRHPLPEVMALAAKFSEMGITDSTQVVVYDNSRFAFAARLWWLLRFLGHDRVSVLDGGFAAWQMAGHRVTTVLPDRRPAAFVPRPQLDWIVDIAEVKAKQNRSDVLLIDSREPERYRGEREPIDPIAGHIPGAVNYPWQAVTNAAGFLIQDDRWSDARSSTEILVYCGSGVTACVNLLALEIAGIKTGRLYAGSWSDWCSYLT
ncbi:MAG: sulfurtransferase [Leptolyngbyaceae cyanobacterium SU_3_3]|nr:sulfurtransferase [Leptolyngbyaceae cyanobacterium SU_3_3]